MKNSNTAISKTSTSYIPQRESKQWGTLLMVLSPLILLLSRFFLPQSLAENRIGKYIISTIYQWGTSIPSVYDRQDFPFLFYQGLHNLFPFMPEDLESWDILALGIGIVVMVIIYYRYSRTYQQSFLQTLLLIVLTIIAGIFVFQVSKDLVQCLIFCIAFFFVCRRNLSNNAKIIIVSVLFALECILWRKYFAITALFVPIIYFAITRLKSKYDAGEKTWKLAVGFIFLVVIGMVVFAYALYWISPSSYNEIVYQHSVEREDFTATNAASGIASVVPLTTGSSPLLFVANWTINIVRLLFPIELLAKSIKYLPYVIYQLFITYIFFRSIKRCHINDMSSIVVAIFVAFLITSAAFEPDFGSWVRHETAALPFVVELIAISGFGISDKGREELAENNTMPSEFHPSNSIYRTKTTS